jgi:hypothetical protein
MHLQIRTSPARSPADLLAFLQVLADAGINIEAAGGGDVEGTGEFAMAVKHGQEEQAVAVLRDNGYVPRLVEVDTTALSNEPGQLLEFVRSVTDNNIALGGRVIRDVSVGVPDADGRIQVQIYSDFPGSPGPR